MRKQFSAVSISLCAALLIASLTLSGCGGGNNSNVSAGVQSMGLTPPPIGTHAHWGTSFEQSEGYIVGDANHQKGWSIGWNPRPNACSVTISNDMAATGSQCLKMDYRSSSNAVWWQNAFALNSPLGIVPDVPLASVTYRMKVYRDPGETEYPEGSGIMHPNIWFNGITYNSTNRYIDFGDAHQDMKLHAALYDAAPRTWGDPGWEQITGRFVEVVIYDNYIAGTRIVWYNGLRVATVSITNVTKSYHEFAIGYCAVNPGVPANLGKPAYIDDIDINWELAF